MISTGYHLPFAFLYTNRALSSGGSGFLRVDFRASEATELIASVVSTFAALASTGALAGVAIEPWRSTLKLHLRESTSPSQLEWSFDRALVCDEALVVLAHMLLATHDRADISRVELVALGNDRELLQLGCDVLFGATFPEVFRQLPFDLEDEDPQGDDFSFEIELASPLTETNKQWLNAALIAWEGVVSGGGYADDPALPIDAYVEADEGVCTFGQMVEWSVAQLRADGACVDAVLNILASFHSRCQQLSSVRLF